MRPMTAARDFFLRAEDGTVWLTQLELAELFQTSIPNINIHIKNVLSEGELPLEATIKEDLIVRIEGSRTVKRPVKRYSLEMILAVGYRVKSARGTQFRQWATAHLKEYLVKGFVMDDVRLKDPTGWDYFDELLQRIRDIRASEKRFYQKVRDLFALSVDYKNDAAAVGQFFAEVQNKMFYAVTRHTAAEIVVQRADSSQPNMALTSWKAGRVRKADWRAYVDSFIGFNESALLKGAGRISHDSMVGIVHERYEAFDVQRRTAEALEADAQDLKELEQAERQLTKK